MASVDFAKVADQCPLEFEARGRCKERSCADSISLRMTSAILHG
jgi:hypothetical protein